MPAMVRPEGKSKKIAERLLGLTSKRRKNSGRSTRTRRSISQDGRRVR
jgi:hypothetical protein